MPTRHYLFAVTAALFLLTLSPMNASVHSSSMSPEVAQEPATDQKKTSHLAYQVEKNGTIKIFYKGVMIVDSHYLYWGKNYRWAGLDTHATLGDDGRFVLTGSSDGLGLTMKGTAQPTPGGSLKLDLLFDAKGDLPGVIGGGIEWSLKVDDPVLAKNAAAPELLDDTQGWSWKIDDNHSIAFRSESPLASAFFERNQKNTIRTYTHAKDITTGQKVFRITLALPEGSTRKLSEEEIYGETDTRRWYKNALHWNFSPVDLRFLNRDDRPAGRRGFLKAEGDAFVFADGSTAKFWGGNLAAYALFGTPRQNVARQARRMAQLGYNLMRIHHHDSDWVQPNLFGNNKESNDSLDPRALDSLDWWIKCLEDEGIYVWLDMRVSRTLRPSDNITVGREDVVKHDNQFSGFDYLNQDIKELMKAFQTKYMSHYNKYTRKAYKDDPAIIGVLITNEDDLTQHFGNMMLPNNGMPAHNKLWTADYKAFASEHQLSAGEVFKTWLPGASKLHLNDLEHRFNVEMISNLRELGVRAPIATTNYWGEPGLFALPSLCDGDMIDVHCYGSSESFNINPRFSGNYIAGIGAGQVHGKPLTITEWNVPYANRDRFTAPLYVASIASLQGWDAPMVYNYAQSSLKEPDHEETWSTFFDPAITGVTPAAALAFRRGHVSPALKNYCLAPGRDLFNKDIRPSSSATIRTLVEQSKLTIGMPSVPELPWLKPSDTTGATVITDPDRDFIPAGQTFVASDTGELIRDWEQGTQTINSEKTQAVSGWIGRRPLSTRDAKFLFATRKAVVALSSVDDLPIASSKFILITTMARVVAGPGGRTPLLSEPVVGRITLRTKTPNLELLSLAADGKIAGRTTPTKQGDSIEITLPSRGGTHWYVLMAGQQKTVEPDATATPAPPN